MPRHPVTASPPLLERESELAALGALLDGAPGAGGLLAIEGPPGIGKTALIGAARDLGRQRGMQVLAGRGSELERSFSHGVVRQLFEPLLARLPAPERGEVLGGAAGLAAPLFDPLQIGAEPAPDSSLATLHGLYWLTANLAGARGPVLVAVDDLQWCDLPSLRWLAYLLPRMEGLGLAVVVGLRPADPREDPALLGQILSDPLAVVVRPRPLGPAAAARLVRATVSPDADEAFCAACWEETDGNPLLLRELARTVAAEGLVPSQANVPRLRALEARAGSLAVALRLARLPPDAFRLAQAVAILGDDADARQAGALAAIDERGAAAAAEALGRVDILRPGERLGFAHPLIRAAVEEGLSPVERGAGHARAARMLADEGAEPERIAAHLLRSPAAGEGWAVRTLREAARQAGARGASESAVAYLRRALAEPPPPDERGELLVELGSAEALVSGDAALEHLQEAHALTDDRIRRAQIALVLGRQVFLLRGEDAHGFLTAALDDLAGADAELERMLEAGLIENGLFVPALHSAALERLERARARPAEETVGEKRLLSLLALHDALAGAPASAAVPLARRALAGGTLIAADIAGGLFIPACRVLAMADLDEVLAIYEDAIAQAHRRGSAFALGAVRAFRAQALLWRGDLGEAEAEAREALAAGEAWGASARFLGHATAFLADALMEQGRLDDATDALARGDLGDALPASARLLHLRDSGARLRIHRGDVAGGLAELLDAGRRFEAVGSRNPAFLAWRSPAALALLRLGDEDEARRLATEEVELARAWGAPRALGAGLRVAGLAEGGDRGLALLEEAVQVLGGSPARLEHAQARTELGAALRRANRRARARAELRHGLELATLCGAAELAARAEGELLASGARPRRVALSGLESLTPSERRVAEMAADGPTNREIAQALFVTQRTVEVHLTSVYRKLGIGSRSQLAATLGGAEDASA